jgi:germination protein M
MITIYLAQGEQLVPVTVRRENPSGNLAAEALEALLEWNNPEWAVSPLPLTTDILSVKVQEQTAVVDFGRQTLSGYAGGTLGESLLLNSLIFTLTSLPGIDRVQVMLEGKREEALFGHVDTLEPFNPPSVVNLEQGSIVGENMVTLWFMDRQAMFSVPVSRSLPKKADWQSALEEFFKGPSPDSPLLSPLPPGTAVLSSGLTDGAVIINLSEEFASNYTGGSAVERLVIQCLVLTLTEFEQVKQVQLLVEGEKGDAFLGHIGTHEPFTREPPNMYF